MPDSIPSSDVARRAVIVGTGSYAPERVMTNADLEELVETSDDWIQSRTGMKERRIAAEDEATSDLAAEAARRALDDAGVDPADVGLILVATATPDMLFPNTASLVQHLIGARNAFCMDIEAACSGFLYALETGRQFIQSGSQETVLVIGAEKMSGILDWQDRTTCVLFGDGAGAAVLQAQSEHGILSSTMGSDGALSELLMVPAGGSRQPASAESLARRDHYIKMQGREVFKNAVAAMTRSGKEVLEKAGRSIDEVACVIPHQANARILSAVAHRLGVGDDILYTNVERYGNTSAASIILAIDEASREGRFKSGDLILCVAFGAGFTWGAMLIEWGK